MSFAAARPVRYFHGQILGIADFEDEQSYHAEARRRHHVTHHEWGIVEGLELRVDGDEVTVDPGLAVDGYGRTVLLSSQQSIDHIDPESMEAFDRAQACCWIEYDRILTSDDQGRPESRWDETPRLTFRYQRSDDDNREPPARPDTKIATAITSWEPLPIDPRRRWPIYLGCIRLACDPSEPRLSADLRSRRFIGLRASSVRSPESKVALQLGDHDQEGPFFSIGFHQENSELREHAKAPPEDPTLAVTRDSGLMLRHDARIEGAVGLNGGSLVFHDPSNLPKPPGWRCYRCTDPVDGSEELRLEIGPEKDTIGDGEVSPSSASNGIVFGRTSSESGAFEPLMSVLADRTVTIHGDLHVTGKINPAYDPLDDLALTEAAEQTLKSAGIAAESGDLARLAATSSDSQAATSPEGPAVPSLMDDAEPPKESRPKKWIGVFKNVKKTQFLIAFLLGLAAGNLGLIGLASLPTWFEKIPDWFQRVQDWLPQILAWLKEIPGW